MLGGSLSEFNNTTLRIAYAAIEAHYEDRRHRYNEAHSLAVLSGMVANMPYMDDKDRKAFQKSLNNVQASDNTEQKALTQEQQEQQRKEFEVFAKKVAAQKGHDTITKPDGQIISGA